ncbi:hypothetical protein JIX56_19600 [Streptomyces sp. CA-210063]|uniref:hypothetical protein n=1 Tax=Streptomyces sp. CA-210063 TaxID=2801029 RepID=UPI00214B2DB8|nr:hypothetical protein [Streptomyces sp. CA-210063]UUU31927.1 hypothetical protein JIX56_19600 [Streptomyces sp. CA-210063]
MNDPNPSPELAPCVRCTLRRNRAGLTAPDPAWRSEITGLLCVRCWSACAVTYERVGFVTLDDAGTNGTDDDLATWLLGSAR